MKWSFPVTKTRSLHTAPVSLNLSGVLEGAQVFLLCLGLISSITFQFGDLGQVSLIFTKKFRTVWWLWRGQIREKSNYNVVVSCINNIQHDHNQTTKPTTTVLSFKRLVGAFNYVLVVKLLSVRQTWNEGSILNFILSISYDDWNLCKSLQFNISNFLDIFKLLKLNGE